MTSARLTRLLALCLTGWLIAQPTHAADKPLFETDIAPLLAKKCGKCHSAKVQKSGLDLSTIAGVRRGGESDEPLIAETVDDSYLWLMLDGGGMPPEDEPQLTKAELALIKSWLAAGGPSRQPVDATGKQITQHDVLPIILLRCTTCHGPRLREGGLDLRTPAAMNKGGDSGPALVPGDPDASAMIQRIESEACPPRDRLLKFFVRRPPTSEVKTLRDWIAAGAPEGTIEPDVATTQPDPLVTDEDRDHWAFRPLKVERALLPVPEKTKNGKRAGVPVLQESIDDFIARKLEEKNLTLSPQADRDTLIRRAYVDLVGIPPSLDEWNKWHNATAPDWYEQMIDHLLASPRYGERWGRYWLDVAGYADSEGGVSADPLREVAWKYRDYVIRAFNEDKPYNRFLLEQLAGDELIDYEHAAEITPQMVDNLTATGFLRMGIDETGSRTMNFVPERLGVISDAIKVVGSGVMGLTMECCRCHSHKYDPIPHRDYYRFKAIFQGALDEHDWLTFKNRTLNTATAERKQRVAEHNPPLAKRLKQLESQLKQAIADLQLETLRQHYPDQPATDRTATLRALKVADNNRTLTQRNLVEMLQRAEVIPDDNQPQPVLDARAAVADIEREILQVELDMEPPLTIRALWDRGEPSPTYILRRGEHDKPGRLVGPGVPSVLTDGRTPFEVEPPFPGKTGRRLAFARWLTQPDHPLTARVMVNRIWYHHFGTGLVNTLENFGRQGERPSHPEFLDWLAVQFVKEDWSIKQMHRLIMTSCTYKQSNRITEDRLERDPQNRLLSRMPLRRMNAEALRDSLLFVSGKLDDTPFGPPDHVTVSRTGLVSANPTATGGYRRSIYIQYRRTEIPTMMETFDYPEMGPNCITRSISTVSPQSLLLKNNQRVRELATAFALRVDGLVKDKQDHAACVDTVYKLALSRLPSDEERQLGVSTLKDLEAAWEGDRLAALETYCHAILNSAAFMFVD